MNTVFLSIVLTKAKIVTAAIAESRVVRSSIAYVSITIHDAVILSFTLFIVETANHVDSCVHLPISLASDLSGKQKIP